MKLVVLQAGTSTSQQLARDLVTATTTALADAGSASSAYTTSGTSGTSGTETPAIEVTTVDVRALAHQVVDVQLTGMPVEAVESALDHLADAAGIIVTTPVFAGSYTGLLKSFVDLIGTQRIEGTPVLLAATGGSTRHSLMLEHSLRPLFSGLRAATIPTAVFAAAEDFANPAYNERVVRAGAQLAMAMLLNQYVVTATTANNSATTATAANNSTVTGIATNKTATNYAADSSATANTANTANTADTADTAEAVQAAGRLSPVALAASNATSLQQLRAATANTAQKTVARNQRSAGKLRPDFSDYVPMATLLHNTQQTPDEHQSSS